MGCGAVELASTAITFLPPSDATMALKPYPPTPVWPGALTVASNAVATAESTALPSGNTSKPTRGSVVRPCTRNRGFCELQRPRTAGHGAAMADAAILVRCRKKRRFIEEEDDKCMLIDFVPYRSGHHPEAFVCMAFLRHALPEGSRQASSWHLLRSRSLITMLRSWNPAPAGPHGSSW